jgi:ribosomal protein S20
MNAQRQIAMVKSVAKNMRTKERQQSKDEKKKDQMYSIMKKVGKALDEVTKDDLTEKEYKLIADYITTVMKCPLVLYPNLK